MLKKANGVSLIQLLVAIVIIIIITSFAIWYASNTSTEAKLARIYSEIVSIKEGYENTKTLSELNPDTYSLDDLIVTSSSITSTYSSNDTSFLNSISNKSKLYLITPENAKKIEAEKIVHSFVIDGLTDNIYLIDGFVRNDTNEVVFEYKDIVRLYKSTLK